MKSENPSKNGRMKRKEYEKELRRLQVELCHLQEWVREGRAIIIVFEGRDAAGKGGTIKAMTERVSPRVFRVVALPAPSDREKIAALHPALHRALPGRRRGRDLRPQLVQPGRRRTCDGLLHEEQHKRFLELCPQFEKYHRRWRHQAASRYWLEVGKEEQERRFHARIEDPRPAMEAEPDGCRVLPALVRLFAGARHHVGSHRYRQPRPGTSCAQTTSAARASTASPIS